MLYRLEHKSTPTVSTADVLSSSILYLVLQLPIFVQSSVSSCQVLIQVIWLAAWDMSVYNQITAYWTILRVSWHPLEDMLQSWELWKSLKFQPLRMYRMSQVRFSQSGMLFNTLPIKRLMNRYDQCWASHNLRFIAMNPFAACCLLSETICMRAGTLQSLHTFSLSQRTVWTHDCILQS